MEYCKRRQVKFMKTTMKQRQKDIQPAPNILRACTLFVLERAIY